MTRRPDSGRELVRAICADGVTLVTFGGTGRVESTVSRPWASATFAGARHVLTLRIEGENAGAAADAFLDGLESREFALRGHILADIAVAGDERSADGRSVRLRLEALTVEDC